MPDLDLLVALLPLWVSPKAWRYCHMSSWLRRALAWEPLTETKSFLGCVKAAIVITAVEAAAGGGRKGERGSKYAHVNIFLWLKIINVFKKEKLSASICNIACLTFSLQFIEEILWTNCSNSVLCPILSCPAELIKFSIEVSVGLH